MHEKPFISLPETVLPAFASQAATFKQFLNGMKFTNKEIFFILRMKNRSYF